MRPSLSVLSMAMFMVVAVLATVSGSADAQTIYGINGAGGPANVQFVEINSVTGAATKVGGTGVEMRMIAYDETTGVMYGSTGTALYTINIATGLATLVGQHNAGSMDKWEVNGMAFDSNGDLYIAHGSGSDGLYSVNKATGQATWIGAWGGSGYGGGLAFDNNDTLYMTLSYPEGLYTLNIGTGARTMVAPLSGYTGGWTVREMAWDSANDVMYGLDFGGGGTQAHLCTINLATGVLTNVGSTGVVPGINGIAIVPPSEPEIDVQRPAGTSLADGSTDGAGNLTVGAPPATRTYTIENVGTADLSLTGTPYVVVQNTTNVIASVTAQPASGTIASGATETFDIEFGPIGSGAFSFDLVIENDDADEGMYTITVDGMGLVFPEIDIQRPAGTSIADGGNDPQGSIDAGAAQTLTYTIENQGTGTVTLTGMPYVEVLNDTNVTATVTMQPASGSVASLTSETFMVEYTVTGAGAFSFDLLVTNDDADEPNYTITVDGTGLVFPEIDVQRPAGTSIASGATDAYGDQDVNDSDSWTYTIANLGNAVLNLTGASLVEVTNLANVTASVSTQPTAATVAAGATDTFTVDFAVDAAGAFSFDIVIASDDADEATYTITVTGMGIVHPEIAVEYPAGTDLTNGTSLDAGEVEEGNTVEYNFTIQSTGTGDLTLTGTPTIDVANLDNATATVTVEPTSTTVATGSSVTFTVTVGPIVAAAFSADIVIMSDDDDEGTFTITIAGIGKAKASSDSCCGMSAGTSQSLLWPFLLLLSASFVGFLRRRAA